MRRFHRNRPEHSAKQSCARGGYVRRLRLCVTACALLLFGFTTDLTVATVNNAHMLAMQRLSGEFERAHPGVRIRWVTLEEGQLRQQVAADIATHSGRFDVMTIGMLETPLWGKRGWLLPFEPPKAYDLPDLLPPVRDGLSVDGTLYAAPFYGESSMTFARADLLRAKGLTLPEHPTWQQIAELAEALHDPAHGVSGICLRGKAGWGENMTLLTTMANSFGGQWFDLAWKPQLTSPAWRTAIALYVDLLRKYGPKGAVSNGFNENLALFSAGRCALWVDASVAGAFLDAAEHSKVAGSVAFAQAPYGTTDKGAHWLWSWALAVPTSSKHPDVALSFIAWATSREYVSLVRERYGVQAVPSGTRASTYRLPGFQEANAYARYERTAIATADPLDSTVPKSPYRGVQFAGIPEFQSIGTVVGTMISSLLSAGSVDEVAARAQRVAEKKMIEAGYIKEAEKTSPTSTSSGPPPSQ
jgi:sorbitol/mannitol transport system substrate-binding protein